MSPDLPARVVQAFDAHDAFDRNDDGQWYSVQTTRFEGRVTATPLGDASAAPDAVQYTVEVTAPLLSTVTTDPVGSAVEAGWLETYELRLADAPMAVPHDLTLDAYRVIQEAGDVVAVYRFTWASPDHVPEIVKAITEFVEGTYMEGIIPGYAYEPPVSDMLANARQSDEDGDHGPMPL